MEDLTDNYGNLEESITDYNWKEERLLYINNYIDSNQSIPFKITAIYESGFKANIHEVYALINFNCMPWSYKTIDPWFVVFPKLIHKTFYCKIYEIIRIDKKVVIYLNGQVPQFIEPELRINNRYNGVIIKILDKSLIIDIGLHFNWDCGSIVGLLPKSNFFCQTFDKHYEEGDEINVIYLSKNSNEELFFSKDFEYIDWGSEEIENLNGKEVWLTVKKRGCNFEYLVNDKYRAFTYLESSIYEETLKSALKKIDFLMHNDIIKCKIISINKEIGFFVMRLIIPLIRKYDWNSAKIKLYVGRSVWVRVIKNNNNLEFKVFGTYRAVMPILTSIEDIDNTDRVTKAVINDINDGKSLQCKITDINTEDEYFVIKWKHIQGSRIIEANYDSYDSYLKLIPQKYKDIQNIIKNIESEKVAN